MNKRTKVEHMKKIKIKSEMQWRGAHDVELIEESRSISLSFSSEDDGVDRYFNGEMGTEILDHGETSVDLNWLRGGTAPFLLDHDREKQIGVIETANVRGKRGEAVVRFGSSPEAEQAFQDVKDKIKSNVSVGYRVNRVIQEGGGDASKPVYRVVDWQPLEISLVSIPADMSVGVGRSGDENETVIEIEERELEMTDKIETVTVPATPVVDVAAERADALSNERKRSADIMALAIKHNKRDLGDVHVGKGTSLDAFRGIMLDTISEGVPLETPAGNVELSEKDAKGYSLFRAIAASASRDWRDAGLEREISDEIASRTGKNAQGFFAPSNLDWSGKRDLTVGTDTAGGYLVGTDHKADQFIDALRANMVTVAAGARVMSGLRGNIEIPALNAKTTSYWVGENAAPTEGAPTFRQVAMSPKTNAAYVDMSRLLLQQSDPSVEAVIRQDLISQLSNAMDVAAIQGSGASNQPTGILNTSGIGDVAIGTNGGAATWAKIVEVFSDVDDANAMGGSMSWIGSPKVRGHLLSTLKAASTDSVMIMQEIDKLLGYNYLATTNSPDDLTKGTLSGAASALIFGDFNSLMIGQWGALDLLADPYTGSSTGVLRLTAFMDVDIAVRHAAAFSAIQDIDSTA